MLEVASLAVVKMHRESLHQLKKRICSPYLKGFLPPLEKRLVKFGGGQTIPLSSYDTYIHATQRVYDNQNLL
jgi:hypothetical protein